MAENGKCSCEGGLRLLFSCSGAADTAELADRATRKVHRTGEAKMYCLAGVGGDVDMIVNNTRAADMLTVIDGCDTDCAAKLLRKAGFDEFRHLRITDLGFEKGQSPMTEEAIDEVVEKLLALVRVGEA
jgi:uncharacterized metal-binding protein